MSTATPYNAGDEASVTKRKKLEREAEDRIANGLTYVLAERPAATWCGGCSARPASMPAPTPAITELSLTRAGAMSACAYSIACWRPTLNPISP